MPLLASLADCAELRQSALWAIRREGWIECRNHRLPVFFQLEAELTASQLCMQLEKSEYVRA